MKVSPSLGRHFWFTNVVVVLFVLGVNLWPVVSFLVDALRWRQPNSSATSAAEAEAQVRCRCAHT